MATLDKQLLETVVLFEEKNGRRYQSLATGYIIGFNSSRKNIFYTFLVTNKHVVNNREEIYVSLDLLSGKRRQRVKIPLIIDQTLTWYSHRQKAVDLALLPISMEQVTNMGAAHKWLSEDLFLYFKDYDKIGLYLGDDVFFVGFPLGLSGNLKNMPLVRKGSVARADKELIKEAKSVIIDGQNFPGNSGGPVFTKPEVVSLDGTKAINRNYLLGTIKGYLPHTNKYVDPSSGQVSAMSVENSGLALYVPIDYAKQIYTSWVRQGKPIVR